MLIGEDGEKIGDVSFEDAKRIAKEQEKDLMLMNKDKSVYKIGDEGKIKYDKKQKKRRSSAIKRTQKVKEIQMRPTIEDSDLGVKLRRVRKFLKDGLKTRLIMKFKRQQMSYRNAGMQKITGIVESLAEEGLITFDSPKFEGSNIAVFLVPVKKIK